LIEGRGSTPLHPLLKALGTIFEDNRKDDRAAITRGIAYLNQFGTTPLFTFAVDPAISHPETYGVYVLQSGLVLATKQRYNDSSILEAYEKAAAETWHNISQNFQLPGVNSKDDIYDAVASAVNFEKQLSLISNSS
jgi:predicted metalloendopeptidase